MKSGTLPIDGEQIAYELRSADESKGYVVFLHGAGSASMERYSQLADELASQGVNVLTFDFSGHGKSTGTLAQLSLARRRDQAVQVIARLCDASRPIVLAGFSMSGQTVCDVVATGTVVPAGIFLGCPAAYRPDVFDIPFGESRFTGLIRETGTWSESVAFKIIKDVEGKVVLIVPEKDEVIPIEVTQTFIESAGESASIVHLEGCHHRIAAWLADRPSERAMLTSRLAEAVLSS